MANKKKILILGVGGFIGRNLANFFTDKNYIVYGTYYKKKPNIKNVQLTKTNLLLKKNIEKLFNNKEIVINAAAITTGAKDIISKPFIHVTDNSIINSLVTRVAFEKKIKHVIMLSCTVMYKSSRNPIKEKDFSLNEKINDKYFGGAWMKIYMEKTSEFFSRFGVNKYTIIRHSNVYGPYDKYDLNKSHFFGATIRKVFDAKKNIVVWGDGTEKRDLLYIKDLCEFINLAIKKQKSNFRIYNVGFGKAYTIKKIVKQIIKISNKNLAITWNNKAPTIKTQISLDCSLAKNEIGWAPKTSLTKGIQKTIDWYSKYKK